MKKLKISCYRKRKVFVFVYSFLLKGYSQCRLCFFIAATLPQNSKNLILYIHIQTYSLQKYINSKIIYIIKILSVQLK